jgi:hypothetical protein
MTQSPLAYQQGSNYITRIEGGQMLYYPIYPVYEIVYEPVSANSSLTPSRIITWVLIFIPSALFLLSKKQFFPFLFPIIKINVGPTLREDRYRW